MKVQMYSRILQAAVIVAALVIGSHGVSGQDAPEIEAFIDGIDNYDDYGDPVISRPDLSGGRDLPPNALPSAESNDFVVAPDLVPEQINKPGEEPAAVANSESNASSDAFVNDYFDDNYYNAETAPPVTRTWVLGITVPIFNREFDGDRLFSVNPADATQTLSSNDADPNGTSGIDINLARRSSTGWGFEARYWGLYSSAVTSVLGGNPTTALSGLGQINDNGVSLADTFNTADFHSLTRDYSFNNVELNLLRNKRNFAPLGRCLTMERQYGLRFMQFDESLEYAGVSSTNAVIRSALNSSVQNSLFGIQTGCRAEWQAFNRTSLTIGGKLGLFNNHARTRIVANNQAANLDFSTPAISSGPNSGAAFDFTDRKNDLSLMGEFDLGLAYQLTRRSRLRAGYRVMGVSDIADAEKNIPADFTNATELQSANTDGDLVLRGGYVGLEFGF